MASVKDDLLQGMIQYLMALAGRDWSDRYLIAAGKSEGQSTLRAFTTRLKERMLADTAIDGGHSEELPAAAANQVGVTRAVRYYRGQPVYA